MNMQVQADLLRRVPVTGPPTMIIVVGIGRLVDTYEVNNMASWPYQQNVINVNSYSDLPTVQSRLTIAICGSEYSSQVNEFHGSRPKDSFRLILKIYSTQNNFS